MIIFTMIINRSWNKLLKKEKWPLRLDGDYGERFLLGLKKAIKYPGLGPYIKAKKTTMKCPWRWDGLACRAHVHFRDNVCSIMVYESIIVEEKSGYSIFTHIIILHKSYGMWAKNHWLFIVAYLMPVSKLPFKTHFFFGVVHQQAVNCMKIAEL